MKKLLVSMMTVGALAAGGAASAQGVFFDNVLPQILGNVGADGPHRPGDVFLNKRGQRIYTTPSGVGVLIDDNNMYTDSDGRSWYADPSGRPVEMTGYRRDAWGRGVYTSADGRFAIVDRGPGSVLGAGRARWGDRDGDGIPDVRDRHPDDPRRR
jgi:hypothetical protein